MSKMKKIITIVISCSLALAAGAMAQQEEASATPNKKQQRKEHAASEAQSPAGRQTQEPGARPRAGRRARERAATENANAQTPAAEAPNASPNARPNAPGQRRKGRNANRESATPNQPATPAAAKENAQRQGEAQAPAPSQPGNAQANTNNGSGKAKRPADVQKIKSQHTNFHAQPKPQQVPAVSFSQSRQISGSENWQGEKYNVFRSYRPERHDQGWYRSHFTRIELIGGGYYYFNAGYWYPAWGYQPSAQYYVYDGPIYAGRQAEPPDRVIADVQASLQEMGYYKGEVDGLLGPLTREALTAYQSDNGLYTTAAIDEPTLESLGLG
jgi:hypothetical protein